MIPFGRPDGVFTYHLKTKGIKYESIVGKVEYTST